MEPWYKVVLPREELRKGRSLDPSEFAVHLEQVVDGSAPRDYVEPEKFFSRNFFSKALVEHCGMVLRRLNGETQNTAPVLSLITQFGGGKTHTLTTLFHLCNSGNVAKDYEGVATMMKQTGMEELPKAKVAVFVGNSWDPQPGRENPWLDIAYQLAGEKGRELFARSKNAPGTKTLGELLRMVGEPVLVLFDETLNYIGRHPDQTNQFHAFMQNLTVALTSADKAVGLFSLPASPTEMTEELREWQDKLTKVVGRVGKDLVASDASEVSEIVRRRLFEDGGRDSMRRAVSRQYAQWVFERKDRLPAEWGQMSEDQIRQQFESCYPFHPATLTVFQRKWATLPQFQQTRTTLAMLGMWISCAYREGYGQARRESLITLGSAPLDDREFLSAVLRQMGETRLQAAILADIAAPVGLAMSHAEALDQEMVNGVGMHGVVQRTAKALFFESCGGQTDKAAHLPELFLAVGDPETETSLIDTAVRGLERTCYYLRTVGGDGWRFGYAPTLRKVHADRKAGLDLDTVRRQVGEVIRAVFRDGAQMHLSPFPKESNEVADQPMLTLAVTSADALWEVSEESPFRQRLAEWTRKCGQSNRQNPGGVLWVASESSLPIKTAVEELLAWQAISDEANRGVLGQLDPEDLRKIQFELNQAKAQIEERVWSSYNHLLLWDGNENRLRDVSLAQLHPSEARSITAAILARLRHESLLSSEIGASYIERNWPPALKDSGMWHLAGLKAAFFQGSFTRLEKPDEALRATITRAIAQGTLGLASGKNTAAFDRVWFKEQVDQSDITFDFDTYLLRAGKAKELKDTGGKVIPPDQPPGDGKPPVEPPKPPEKPDKRQKPKELNVCWEGSLRREQWNLFSLKVLTRLSQAEGVEISVKVHAKIKEAHTLDELNSAVKELGLQGEFEKEC